MKKLFFDIEALPAEDEKMGILKLLYEKKRAKSPEKEIMSFEEYHRLTSLDGAFGRILCIGYAVNDKSVDMIYEENDERKMLLRFWALADDIDLFIGHFIFDYDLKFLYQRSIIHNVRPPRELNFARYRKDPIFDTAKEWAKWSTERVSLEKLALSMGIPSPKVGIDGSQVYDFFKAGKVKEILEYCKRDVEATRAVYKRIAFV